MNLHTLLEAIGSLSVAGILIFVWNFSGKFNSLVQSVNDIKNNHLPHIEAKIDRHIEWHVANKSGG